MGKVVNVNGYPFTVVGIAPPEFTGTIASSPPDVYAPIMMLSQVLPSSNADLLFGPRSRSSGWLHLLGRLKPGVSRNDAPARNGGRRDRGRTACHEQQTMRSAAHRG